MDFAIQRAAGPAVLQPAHLVASSTHFRYAQATVWVIFLGALVLLAWQLPDVLLLFGAITVAVELPPVLGIMAAMVFGLLFGLAGVILATPLMVVAMVLVQKLYVEGVLEAD
jgi:predicted PurR-regulated permease PerM